MRSSILGSATEPKTLARAPCRIPPSPAQSCGLYFWYACTHDTNWLYSPRCIVSRLVLGLSQSAQSPYNSAHPLAVPQNLLSPSFSLVTSSSSLVSASITRWLYFVTFDVGSFLPARGTCAPQGDVRCASNEGLLHLQHVEPVPRDTPNPVAVFCEGEVVEFAVSSPCLGRLDLSRACRARRRRACDIRRRWWREIVWAVATRLWFRRYG